MNKFICFLFVGFSLTAQAQPAAQKSIILYGACTKDSLMAEPFRQWFSTGYNNYQPTTAVTEKLQKIKMDNISIDIFFGTWCGDSKREVPRFLKLLQTISFPDKKISLIGLGSGDSLVKQSPQHEETGKGIFRVPTFIIYKNGVEINRINEYPVYSLETDLLQILSNEPVTSNYQSFATVKKWLADGTLIDENNSTAGLAGVLRLLVKNENELNSLGYLLLSQGKKKEALRIFQVNFNLYPESANIISSLGEGYFETGDYKKAVALLERALEMNKVPGDIKGILDILYKAKAKE